MRSYFQSNPNFAPALNNLAYLYAERLNDLDKASSSHKKRGPSCRAILPSLIPLVGFSISGPTTSNR